jgi:multicomponent Na+:H+ antiporter subunit G
MMEWIVSILLMSGALFMLVAAIGVVKLSDVYMRMHAITKAASLGAILMLAAVVLWHPQWIVGIEALMVVLFVIFTAPVGAHMLARVAYRMKVHFGDGYVMDELKSAVEKGELDGDSENKITDSIDQEKI